MATLIIQLLIGIIGLGATVFLWWTRADADKKKEKADIDKEIDAANSITDFIHIDDELRDK